MTPPTNALFVQEDQFSLLAPGGLLSGPLTELRAAVTKLRAKGPTTLVLAGELATVKLPANLPISALRPFLQAQYPAQVVLLPTLTDLPTDLTVSLIHQTALDRVRGAVRGTPLKLVTALTLADAAQSAAGIQPPFALLHDTGLDYDLTVRGPDKAQSRRSKRTRGDDAELTEQLKRLTQPLLIANVTPTLLLSGPAADAAPAIEAALKLPTVPLTLDQLLTGALQPAEQAAVHVLHTPRTLDKPLLATLAAALLINGGLLAWGALEGQRAAALDARAQQLEGDAVIYRALKAANDALQTRQDQARALTEQKGPLAADLPLIAQQTVLSGGQLATLSGPNLPDADAIRQYGQAVTRTYRLTARTRDAQRLIDGYGQAGLAIHVSEVACTPDGCDVQANIGTVQPGKDGGAGLAVTPASTPITTPPPGPSGGQP